MRLILVALLGLAGCGDEPDPAWCTARAPLQVDCPGPHCVGAVVVDYKRLEPRGYRIYALEGSPIDTTEAERRAVAHVQEVFKAPPPDAVEARRELHFFHVYLHYQESGDSYLAILHAPTGELLFAGLEEWANPDARGHDFPLPEGFRGSEALGCQRGGHEPREKKLVTTGAPTGTAPASTAAEAWQVARLLNLTVRLVGERPYEVLVISHAPAVGEFDPEAADWYVWLYRL